MTRIRKYILLGLCSMLSLQMAYASPDQSYLEQDQYEQLAEGHIYEDRGIVLENHPKLGYMTYRNGRGEAVTAHYYSSEMVVEKTPYYEQEDKVGYIDELFPSFNFDARDTTVSSIQPGDNIYLRMDKEGYVTYISAYNDYTVRYGKVHTWTGGSSAMNTLVIEDQSGRLYNYKIPVNTPITKAQNPYSLGLLQEGEWVRLLVSQKILGYGIVEEEVKEIVVDPDHRVISDVTRGEVVGANTYQNTLNLQDAQHLNKGGWTPYEDIVSLRVDPRTIQSYHQGNPVSYDYVQNRLTHGGGYVYAAVESFMGKEQAVKLNFQSKKQVTLDPSTVIYASPGVVELLSGEQLFLSDDSIIVRGDRLVGPASLMVGDTLQAVVTGEHKVAVGRVLDHTGLGTLEIFRGRIRQVEEQQYFEVETFSMLKDGDWYFHPVSRSYAIDATTKLVTEEGVVSGGINQFLDYGENAQEDQVYTIIARGDQAELINAMPYTKESIRGYAYATEDGDIWLRDVKVYDERKDRWRTLQNGHTGVQATTLPNTIIIKEGELVSIDAIEVGDEMVIMMREDLYEQNEDLEDDDNDNDDEDELEAILNAKVHIIVVE